MSPLRRSLALRATLLGLAVAATVFAAGLVGALGHIRADLTGRSDALATDITAITDLPGKIAKGDVNKLVSSASNPVRVIDADGTRLLQTGSADLWARKSPGTTATWAVVGAAVHLRDGAVEVTRRLGNGRTLIGRADVPRATMGVSGATWAVLGLGALAGGLIAMLLTALAGRRRRREIRALTAAAESLLSGRFADVPPLAGGSELSRANEAIRGGAQRLEHLSEVADRELGLLTAAIEPLPIGVAGRGPAGGRLRNVAMDRLVESLTLPDRTALDAAVRDGLEATDPVGGRVPLSDGRVLEVDAWTVPGGRLVSVVERTEQERLATFRRQLEGAAVRQLRAPLDEVKTRGKELYQHVPAPAASTLRSLLGATDRLDRVVRMMLRGTSHDPAMRPPRRETFGVAGFLWGLAHDWDAALRQRALRVELDIASDLPDVQTDPALVQEILTELIDNAAKFTPRGGTVKLGARCERDELVLDVRDSGSGVHPHDAAHATERFFRGQLSESIPGAGLGLGVAAALADRLGGRIEVIPGDGGHVRLMVPVRGAERQAA